jgi:hypothetical protein
MSGRVPTVLLVSGLVGAALVAGCQRAYPEASADAVLRFLRNARLNGRLRVCWPAGQAYVEKVMRADAALRDALAAVAPIQTFDALWSREDPQWRAKFEQKPAETPADETQGMTTGPAGTGVSQALDALAAAIEQVPAGIALDTPNQKDAFVQKVWEALAVEGVPLRGHVAQIEALGDLHKRLEDRIASCCQSFAADASGLTFSDEACQHDVDALYGELAAALRVREEAFLKYAAEQMAQVHARIGKVNKQKQRDEYLELDNIREYFDGVLRDGWLKRLDDRIRAADRKLAAHQAGTKLLAPAEAKFLPDELARMKERYATLSQRVHALLTSPASEAK